MRYKGFNGIPLLLAAAVCTKEISESVQKIRKAVIVQLAAVLLESEDFHLSTQWW